jgi:hypothetical protein
MGGLNEEKMALFYFSLLDTLLSITMGNIEKDITNNKNLIKTLPYN